MNIFNIIFKVIILGCLSNFAGNSGGPVFHKNGECVGIAFQVCLHFSKCSHKRYGLLSLLIELMLPWASCSRYFLHEVYFVDVGCCSL